jgi:large subunit ribosomal protein L5
MARLFDYYKDEVVPRLKEKFPYRNPLQVPKVEKVIINMGLGEAIDNIKVIDSAVEEIGLITGQKAVVT